MSGRIKKLIINADDLGMWDEVNDGILRVFTDGPVRSASIIANGDAFERGVEIARSTKGLGVGVHLNITEWRALTKATTFTDENGYFSMSNRQPENIITFSMEQIERELEAQIVKCLESGINLTHMDSHHHIHMNPRVMGIASRLGRKYGLAVRRMGEDNGGLITTDVFCGTFNGTTATVHSLIELMGGAFEKGDTAEIMCHPATRGEQRRINELNILLDDRVMGYIFDNNIEIINYGQL